MKMILHCHRCESSFEGTGATESAALLDAYNSPTEHVQKLHPEIAEAHDGADGEPCPNGVRDCPGCVESARDAGIPLSVILGRTNLRNHFPDRYIDQEIGNEVEHESRFERLLDRADLERKRGKGE
jgi:hypothetical protein